MISYQKLLLDGLEDMAQRSNIIRDTHGNLSVIDRDREIMYIKPSGMEYDQITLEDICAIDMRNGEPLRGNKRKPSVDTQHHLTIYQKLDWVGAICHTHSPYATAWSSDQLGIPCYLTEQADYFGGHIPTTWPMTGPDEWGEKAADILLEIAPCPGVLLRNHGVLTIGRTPVKALRAAVALENVAEKSYLIRSMRPDARPIPSSIADQWSERYRQSYGQR